ncbi:ribonuclease H-like domain-containing protein [Patescibacteria group bacterium]|nr:ribonuclease H-like domain-containing protein [Patescibacteria group bacterium]
MADTIVFDIETKKEFSEVGGRNFPQRLGVAVLAAYSYLKNDYVVFEEHELKEFERMLEKTGLLIGFNIKSFDIPVLQPYVSLNLTQIPMLDLMDAVISGAGFRVSLDNLSRTTLGTSKSADGLTALEWFREGRVQDVKDYCRKDVEITKRLYEFGKEHGHVKFVSRRGVDEVTISVAWADHVPAGASKDRQARLI